MSEWKKVKLKDVADIFSGYAFKSKDMNNNCGTPLIKIKNINDFIVSTECDSFLNLDIDLSKWEKYRLQINDFLIAMTGQGSVGRVGKMMNYSSIYFVNQRVAIVRPNCNLVNPYFLYKIFATNERQLELFKKANGAGQPNISPSQIGDVEFYIPNIKNQHRIATILSRYDSLIENYQKQIRLLEESAQRLYKEWFIDLRFPGHENTKIVDGVPEGWEKKKLSDIANIIMGQSPKSEFYNSEKIGLPFHQGVGSYGFRFVVNNVYSTCFTRIAEPNSILFSVRAPVGRLNITKNKIVIGRGLASINHKKGCQSYLYYLLKEKFFKDNIIGNGAIFASISKEELYKQPFVIPSDEMIMRFDNIVNKIDKNIQYVDSQIRHLTEARDRLLPKLMNGEIEV
jgi:type I restriction enzyme S subunit